MSTKVTKKTAQWLILLAAFVVIMLIPTSELFTPTLRTYLAITVAGILLFAFDLLNNMVSSLILMFAYGIAKVCPLSTALSNWISDAVWMTFASFVLVVLVQKTTILERIAYGLASKVKGSYMGLVFCVAAISLLGRLLMQGALAAVSVLAIVFGMCKALNLGVANGKGKEAAGLLLTASFVYLDANYFLYSPGYIGIMYRGASSVVNIPVDYVSYFKDNAVFIIPLILAVFVVGLICRPKESLGKTDFFEEKLKELGPWTVKDKKMLVILVLFIVYLFTNSIHNLGMTYGFILVIIIPFLPGIDIGEKSDFAKVNWGGIFFVAACMTIGTVGSAAGFGKFISAIALPYLQNMSNTMFLGATYFLSVGLNFIMTPAAVMSVLAEPLAQICVDLGFSANGMIYCVYQGISQLLFSYEVTVFMVAFSFGMMSTKEFAKPMFAKFLVQTIFLFTVGMLYWGLVGVI